MLKHLNLKNFVLVEHLEIDFGPGLSAVTGESGAGKSILLSALGLILGNRASAETVRPSTEKADVNAEFDLSNLPHVQAMLLEADLLDEEPQSCLIRRVVSNQGRSRAFINGVPVTTTFLRQIGDLLVDVHGQNEHIQLSNRAVQLQLLDDYAGTQVLAAEVQDLFRDWQAQQENLHRLQEEVTRAQDKKDLLTYQLNELEEFALADGEFDSLDAEHKRLASAHDTLVILQKAQQDLDTLDDLRANVRAVESIQDDHQDLTSAQANLSAALALFDDAARDLSRYSDQVIIDPNALQKTEHRLNMAQDLARKHNVEAGALPNHTEELRQELDAIDHSEANLESLEAAMHAAQERFAKRAQTLSNKRKKAAPIFASLVSHYMQELGISQGRFDMAFSETQGEHGIDRIEFMVTTNKEFEPGPLTQIASGGEQTRISLSIQIVAAQHSQLPCLVLDEADVGVGGTTADTVGRILRDLGQHTQVLCVTHAPQVAALGNRHYRVLKQGNQTEIEALDDSMRVDELARMLAGADITDKTKDYARSLLAQAVA
ncbi:MAG: DNA repair protein RecN [Pseudomonadota bacterium]